MGHQDHLRIISLTPETAIDGVRPRTDPFTFTFAGGVGAAPSQAIVATRINTYTEPQTSNKPLILMTYVGPTVIH